MSLRADALESAQLAKAERLLLRAESAWADTSSGADRADLVSQLCHALRDVLRVARSRGELYGTGEAVPQPVRLGPWAVAYRWPGDPAYVSAARRVLRRHLEQWGLTELTDTAELIVSELVTNAVRHAADPDQRLVETRYALLPDGSLRIEVHDAGDSRPELRRPLPDADSGRGLLLVDVLTGGRWGVSDREGVGKLVWAVCAGAAIDPVSAVSGQGQYRTASVPGSGPS